jgi:hypothetical protein
MKVTAINLARVLFLLPGGYEITSSGFWLPDLTRGLVDRYEFMKAPQTLDEWAKEGGKFLNGRHGNIIISQFLVLSKAIGVDTRTNTGDSETVLRDALMWASDSHGLNLRLNPARMVFVSQITFVSDISLNWLHPSLKMLADRAGRFASPVAPGAAYETTSVMVKVDDSNLKAAPGTLTIERRLEVPFSENTYFSQAPMPTSEHQKALEDFESALLNSRPNA